MLHQKLYDKLCNGLLNKATSFQVCQPYKNFNSNETKASKEMIN